MGQQRPLATEDAETIGAGRVLIEGGVDYGHDVEYTVSGLTGNLTRIPALGVSVGLSSIAEIQFDGSPYNHLAITSTKPAPLSSLLTVTGDSTHDVSDIVVATKIRVVPEGDARPAFGVRFATKLPNARNESGLGLDTTDFYASLLVAKTIQSVRLVGNVGSGISAIRPTVSARTTFSPMGSHSARALTQAAEIVGEVRRTNLRGDGPLPGSESRSLLVRRPVHMRPCGARWDARGGWTHRYRPVVWFAGITTCSTRFTVP
jgi:hypothetical protein